MNIGDLSQVMMNREKLSIKHMHYNQNHDNNDEFHDNLQCGPHNLGPWVNIGYSSQA